MTEIEVSKEAAPSYWAPYLINGDASGLTTEEIAECDAWQKWLGDAYVVSCEEEIYFGSFYFAVAGRSLKTDLVEYTLHSIVKDDPLDDFNYVGSRHHY